MKNRFAGTILWLLLSSLLIPSPATSKTSPRKAGPPRLQYVIQDLQGTVFLRDKKTGKTSPAREEETLQAGDAILTRSGARASLSLNRKTLVRVSGNSEVVVGQLSRKGDGVGFLSRLKLLGGRILAEVEDLRESRSTFEVSSGGVVCGVRGTAFEVQKEEDGVQTDTFHGVVEVQKGDKVQTVEANQSLDFAFDENTFLPKRTLTQQERDQYQKWLTQKAVVERKQRERQVVLDSMETLSEEEQADLLQKLDQIPDRDRLRTMRELLQNRYQWKRSETLRRIGEEAKKKREDNNRLRRKP